MSEPLVVVGNGMAATRFVDELMQRALGRYSVIVIGAEPRLSYNRVLLSSLLAGDVGESAIELKPRGWWNRRGVTTLHGQAVASIDRRARVATLANGQRFTFSKLVLATGSQPVRLPKPGMDLQNVLTFRDLADVGAMRALMRPGARAAVIGGGLLGIEAAHGLAKAGVKVALVHLMGRLMERQLDDRAALLLKRAIEAEGIEVLLGADTKRVLGGDRAIGLELSDARVLPADFVVCAVGIRPNAELARKAGLAVNGWIMVDDGLAIEDMDDAVVEHGMPLPQRPEYLRPWGMRGASWLRLRPRRTGQRTGQDFGPPPGGRPERGLSRFDARGEFESLKAYLSRRTDAAESFQVFSARHEVAALKSFAEGQNA
jgi:nitrite reductase (NADH) large subunit